jgi:hypothetical protein
MEHDVTRLEEKVRRLEANIAKLGQLPRRFGPILRNPKFTSIAEFALVEAELDSAEAQIATVSEHLKRVIEAAALVGGTRGLPDPAAVDAAMNSLIPVVTHQGFLDLLREIEEAPPKEKTEVASRLASVDALRARGVAIPEDFRVSMRWFEDPLTASVKPGTQIHFGQVRPAEGSVCASAGFFVCVSIGGPVAEPGPRPNPPGGGNVPVGSSGGGDLPGRSGSGEGQGPNPIQ